MAVAPHGSRAFRTTPSQMVPTLAGVPGAELAILAMAFAWGATLGSFINVVVHRVPRRQSVAAGASRCPACGTPILPRDNIPVFGWILLRGRCRACATTISPRYPLVEAACGGIAAAIAAAELVGGGRSLPWLAATAWQGIDRLLVHGDFRLAASWALHTGVVLTIVAWSLLGTGADGHRVSACTAWATILIVVAVMVAVPDIGPPGIAPAGGRWPGSPRLAALAASVAGLAAALPAGGVASAPNARWSLALMGATVGWQTLTVVAMVTASLRGILRSVGWRSNLVADPLPGVALAAIVLWKPIRDAIKLSWTWAGGG